MTDTLNSLLESPVSHQYWSRARRICEDALQSKCVSEDEITVLAIVAGQLALGHYVAPEHSEKTDKFLNEILSILDHHEAIIALQTKMEKFLQAHQNIAPANAPDMVATPNPYFDVPPPDRILTSD